MPKKKKKTGFRRVAPPRTQTLDAPATGPLHRPRPSPKFSFEPGDHITDELTVIGHLYIGDFAELYQVWSSSYTCALTCKMLLPGFAPRSPEGQSFKREASVLKKLNHPNVVRFFQQGQLEGRDFLIQEYLHGPTLLALIDSAPKRQLEIQEAVKATIHVCGAVDHLHNHGFAHRDLKPANVILRGGIPVLVDFGSAFRLGAGRKPARLIGTDPYMAPEQCLKQELSFASDVYGLGAVLYEMLTGRWPYEDDIMKSGTESEELSVRFPQINARHPQPPGRFNSQVPSGLDRLVLSCLDRQPQNRPQTVKEVVRNLANFLEKEDLLWHENLNEMGRIA